MTTSLRESDILKTIMDGLAAKKIWRKRMNSGAMFGSHKGKRWAVRFGESGMADILVSFKYMGRTQILWVECKNIAEKQTADQLSFEKEVLAIGHDYIVARSWEDMLAYLQPWGL